MKRLVASTLVLFALFAGSAHALTVFDPSNFAQNYLTAVNAIRMEANTASSLSEQIRSTLYQASAIRSLDSITELTGLKEELALYEQLKKVDTDMLASVNRSASLLNTVTGQYGASGLSWESFLSQRDSISESRRNNLSSRYATLTAEMQAAATRRQAIVRQLESAGGQTQALQAVGSAVDVLIGQNQQMMATLSAQGQAALSRQMVDEASRKMAISQANAYQNRLRASARTANGI